MRAILARLSPREAAITETVIARMAPEVHMSWLAELSALDVDQAVEAVRSMIPTSTPAKLQTATPATAANASTMPAAKAGFPIGPTKASEAPTNAPAAPPRPSHLPSHSPRAMDHFLAIQAALTPEEAASVRAAASALSPLELCALIDEFSAMSVPEAVARVRALLAGARDPEAA